MGENQTMRRPSSPGAGFKGGVGGISACIGQATGVNRRTFSLTVLEAGGWEFQVEVLQKGFLVGESLLPGLHGATFLPCPHKTERQSSLVALLMRTAILSDQGPHPYVFI